MNQLIGFLIGCMIGPPLTIFIIELVCYIKKKKQLK